ncbi:hypothetical protein OYC64_001377 [Pagothenia borchgrevinki]
MQAIAEEFVGISNNLKGTKTNTSSLAGAALGGLGLTVGLAAAFLPAPGKLALCLAGGIAAGCVGGTVVAANATKAATEILSRDRVKDLGEEFMQIIELLKGLLVDINKVSQELEEKSSSLMTTTGNQAKIGLAKTEKLQQLLKQTATLSEKSKEVVDGTLHTLRQMKKLLHFIFTLSRITPTADDDEKLSDFITHSALLCEKTVREFAKMRNVLRDYEEMQAK